MLTLSDTSINLNNPGHRIRFTVLVHGLAFCLLWCSGLPVILKFLLTLSLLYFAGIILTSSSPIKQLAFRYGQCITMDPYGQERIYNKHRVLLEAGIFFLLELSRDNASDVQVIFFDEMSAEAYRMLRLMEKINQGG